MGKTGLTKTASVQVHERLFDEATHQEVIEYVNNVVPLYRKEIDNNEFIRESYHDLPFFVGIHKQLATFASSVFGEPVKPSYCFLSRYKDKGACPLHVDRPQCRFTIDYLIQSTSKEPWPICISNVLTDKQVEQIQNPKPDNEFDIESVISGHEWNTVNLKPNDAVMYSGTHSWHYRPSRLNGEADLIFFHFVKENFDGPLK